MYLKFVYVCVYLSAEYISIAEHKWQADLGMN